MRYVKVLLLPGNFITIGNNDSHKFSVKSCRLLISTINTLYENNACVEIFCQVNLFRKAFMLSNFGGCIRQLDIPLSSTLLITSLMVRGVFKYLRGHCVKAPNETAKIIFMFSLQEDYKSLYTCFSKKNCQQRVILCMDKNYHGASPVNLQRYANFS